MACFDMWKYSLSILPQFRLSLFDPLVFPLSLRFQERNLHR